MAIGFTPKHTTHFELGELNPTRFLILVNESAASLGWNVFYISEGVLKANTNRSLFLSNELIEVRLEEGTVTIKSSSLGHEMHDLGRNKKNVKQLIAAVEQLKERLTFEQLDQKYEELNLVPSNDEDIYSAPQTTKEKLKRFFSLFLPVEGYFITPVIFNINLIFFIVAAISGVSILAPEGADLIKWGANYGPQTLAGAPWRVFSSMFLHIGILHLLMNMYALIYIGVLLEPYLGKLRFASAYLICGIAASIGSLWWNSFVISAGASGAIFGLYGVFLAMLATDLIEEEKRKNLLISIGVFVVFSLLYGFKGGIDNAAHLAGLITGIIVGYIYTFSLKQPEELLLKFASIGLLIALLVTTSIMVYREIPNDLPLYESRMRQFTSNESMALEVFRLPKDTPKDQMMYEIKDRGIYYWNENLIILEEVQKMDLPDEVEKRIVKLREYCHLRIRSNEFFYAMFEKGENPEQHQAEIKEYGEQIEDILSDLRQ